jgi:hypothetical protein
LGAKTGITGSRKASQAIDYIVFISSEEAPLMAGVLHETFRFSNKNLGQFNERYIFSDSGSHYISSGHAF